MICFLLIFFYFVGSGSSASSRQSSHVWNYFSKEPTDDPGRFVVRCMLCIEQGKTARPLAFGKGAGTGTLNRHLESKHGITRASHESAAARGEQGGGLRQTQIGGFTTTSPGGGMPFAYNRDRMVQEFATYVTLDELPFSHGESENLERMIKTSLNPAFRRIPRNTLKRHTQKQYYSARANLIEFFSTFAGKVSLTSDCWSSSQGEPYICITVHWIDSDFILQKRIIAFDVMDESHSGYNIKQRILETTREFNLVDMIFSISLDNASANKKCIDYIRPEILSTLNGVFLHVRFCAHIIKLSAKK